MPFFTTTDLTLYYETAGAGAPLLFMNGTGGDLRAKPSVMDGPLPDAVRVIAYDQRGMGQTDKPTGPYTMAQYADDAAALLAALALPKVDVMGVSFGGMVALNFVLQHPHLVRRLVLCCTSPGGTHASFPLHTLPDKLSIEERLTTMMAVSDTRQDAIWQANNPEKVQQAIEFMRAAQHRDHRRDDFVHGARQQLVARAGHDVTDRLAEIAVSTLICAGKYDGMAPLDNQAALLAGIPQATLNVYEGGHGFLVQDKQAFPDIIHFLTQ